MESLDARLQSFAKAKRVKSSSGKFSVLKWTHSSSFSANPNTLAEAGFYYNPSPDHRDSVKCFMCGKELSDWEDGDDPFAIHLEKARGTCPWALVRCYFEDDEQGNPDPSLGPSSKAMEKARIATFGSNWPHDSVRGHGANSKKMAKAGFAYTPQMPDDDTATCFYCGVALSGWDADDNPLDEHHKREVKSGIPCKFLNSITLASSSSTKPVKAAARPPSRSNSRKKIVEPDPESQDEAAGSAADEGSDDEFLVDSGGRNSRHTRISTLSRASTLTTLPSKTPGSRRSTRTTGNTTARSTRSTVPSEVEGDGETGVSEEESGKKVSKSKSKTRHTAAKSRSKGKEKEHIEAIEEEVEGANEVDEQHVEAEAEVYETSEKPKRGRGRPPGSGKGRKAATSKSKKVPISVASTIDEVPVQGADSDVEILSGPPESTTKSSTSRTQSRPEDALPVEPNASSQSRNHTKFKSSAKPAMEVEVVVPPPPSRSHGKARGKHVAEIDAQKERIDEVPTEGKAKVSRSKGSKPLLQPEPDEESFDPIPQGPPKSQTKRSNAPKQVLSPDALPVAVAKTSTDRNAKRKSSTTSDDAGYATAYNHMDVDDLDARSIPKPSGKDNSTRTDSRSKAKAIEPSEIHAVVHAPLQSSRSQLDSQTQQSTQHGRNGKKHIARASSRSFARVPSRNGHASAADAVDVSSSDDEDELLAVPPAPSAVNGKSKISPPVVAKAAVHKPNGELRIPSKPVTPVLSVPSNDTRSERPEPSPASQTLLRDTIETDTDVEMTDAQTGSNTAKLAAPTEAIGEDLSNATPPPHTPSDSARNSEPPTQPPLPSFDEEFVASAQDSYTPFLSLMPLQRLTALTEEESNMTVEAFIRREIELQYQQFQEDGNRRIAEFREKAAETRRILETA